jgi:hypothetical protein
LELGKDGGWLGKAPHLDQVVIGALQDKQPVGQQGVKVSGGSRWLNSGQANRSLPRSVMQRLQAMRSSRCPPAALAQRNER